VSATYGTAHLALFKETMSDTYKLTALARARRELTPNP
jgi:hypothetical protein